MSVHNEPFQSDDELSKALRRVEAPHNFAERVLGRLGSEPVHIQPIVQAMRPDGLSKSRSFRHDSRFRALRFSPALAAALLLMLLPLGGYFYQRHRQAQAEAAAQQFTLAMRLTHAALLDAGQQVAEHGHARNPE
jgi:hypothetical protein